MYEVPPDQPDPLDLPEEISYEPRGCLRLGRAGAKLLVVIALAGLAIRLILLLLA